MTQRCSSSLLGDELLQIFVNFVNSEAYGPTALADAFVEIEGRRLRRAGAGVAAGIVAGGDGAGSAGGDDSLRGRAAAAAAVAVAANGLAPRSVEDAKAPAAGTAAMAAPPSSHPFRVSNSSGGAGGGVLLLSESPPFLSVDRRTAAEGAPPGLAAGAAGGRGEDDAMESLRRLMGLWLFFHEMARSSSLAKVSKLVCPRVGDRVKSIGRRRVSYKRRSYHTRRLLWGRHVFFKRRSYHNRGLRGGSLGASLQQAQKRFKSCFCFASAAPLSLKYRPASPS